MLLTEAMSLVQYYTGQGSFITPLELELRSLYKVDWDSHFSLNYYTEVHDSMCCLAPHFRLSSQLSRSLGRPFDIRDRAEIASHDCVAKDDTLTKMVVPTF